MVPATTAQSRSSERMCVGCRGRSPRAALLRLVRAGEPASLVPDVRRTAGGRGYSVHPRRRCIELALKRNRARGVQALEAQQLVGMAEQQYRRRMAGLLAAAVRRGKLAVGGEAVRRALAERTVRLLIVAADASPRSKDLAASADRLGRRCLMWEAKTDLGRLLGRDTVGVVAVLDDSFVEPLRCAAAAAAQLAEDA